MQRIEERDRAFRNVPQLDKLIVARVGVVVNLAEDNRANARADVARLASSRQLRGELLFTRADDVASEADSGCGGAKAEAVAVASDIGVGVAGSEVNGIPVRVERKAVQRTGLGVEFRFREHAVRARR